jgi:EAL domain-containing protein (putative c-di-GMP-specific phosphodiesterase class I)/GGDEF domain-containing protein
MTEADNLVVQIPARPAPFNAPGRRSETLARLARERLETDPEEAANLALRSIDSARTEADQLGAALGMLLLSQACHAAGHDPEEIFRPVRYAIDQLKLHNDKRNLADARLLLATLYLDQCAYEEAATEARAAVQLASIAGDPHLEAMCELRLATVLCEASLEHHDQYRRRFEESAKRFLEFGDTKNAARALYNLAVTALTNDPRESARVASRALELCADDAPSMRLGLHIVRTEAAVLLGWIGVAETELAAAEHLALLHVQPVVHQIGLGVTRAHVFRATGRLDDARAELNRHIDRAATSDDKFHLCVANEALATVCEHQGDFVGALSAARAQHAAHLAMKKDEATRRSKVMEMSDRLEAERRASDELRTSQAELELIVDQARAELAQAEQMLEWERSRRSLVELRAGRDPGVEPLTGLPNLSAIASAITKLLDDLARIAVVVVTIDDDRLVAPMPDARQRLLQEMSARTHAFLRRIPGAFAGSLGSEDIVAIVPLPVNEAEIHATLADLHTQLCRPADLVDRTISVTVQLGVALAPDHGVRANGLLSRARLAAQAAKQQRPYGAPVAVFEASVEHRQQMRTFVYEHLGTAIKENHIEVFYQPIVNGRTGAVTGAEALVRWIDPERGLITPNEFIPLAEETGQIVQLGGYVLQRACCEAAAWPTVNGRQLCISVNVSAAQIAGGTILTQVEAALLVSGLDPSRLALELTESTLATHGDVVSVLQAIRAKGIRVEIDDFGTGYSSFSYLTRFPVDTVKIDKSFVDRIATGVDDAAITQAIITMAHSLRLTVIAEGIEYEEQAAVLREQGCDEFQGWLFHKAVAPDEFNAWLTTQINQTQINQTQANRVEQLA